MKTNFCKVSSTPLTKIIDFGFQPLGNGFLEVKEYKNEYFYPMEIGYSEVSMMFQLLEQPAPEKMFHGEYAFYSSTSRHMQDHFGSFSDWVIASDYLSSNNPFVVELGCNDGILIKNFAAKGIRHIGVEPSKNVAAEAQKYGVRSISEFFGAARCFFGGQCHVPYPRYPRGSAGDQ